MNRQVPRVVPTLTEVLDEARWQSAEAAAQLQVPAEPAASIAPAEIVLEPSFTLPDLQDPVLDLSDPLPSADDLPPWSADQESPQLDSLASPDLVLAAVAFPDEAPAPEPQGGVPEDFLASPGFDALLRQSLQEAMAELAPSLAEMLLPVLRERLRPQLERWADETLQRATGKV